MSQKEEILKEATTKQAIALIGWYHLCIAKNFCKMVNKAVHKYPWVCMIATIVTAIIVSFVFISKARAERDSYNKKNVSMQMQLDSYRAVYSDSGKEVR